MRQLVPMELSGLQITFGINNSKVEIAQQSKLRKENQPKVINKSFTEFDGKFNVVVKFEKMSIINIKMVRQKLPEMVKALSCWANILRRPLKVSKDELQPH